MFTRVPMNIKHWSVSHFFCSTLSNNYQISKFKSTLNKNHFRHNFVQWNCYEESSIFFLNVEVRRKPRWWAGSRRPVLISTMSGASVGRSHGRCGKKTHRDHWDHRGLRVQLAWIEFLDVTWAKKVLSFSFLKWLKDHSEYMPVRHVQSWSILNLHYRKCRKYTVECKNIDASQTHHWMEAFTFPVLQM